MPWQEPTRGELVGPLELRKMVPFQSAAASDRLGWVGLDAARYALPTAQLDAPGITHHTLALITRPPEKLELRLEGVKRQLPPPAGSIMFIPAGSTHRWRWCGRKDSLHIYLETGLLARVAAEAFELDPAQLEIRPLDGAQLPQLRAAMAAVDAELTAGGLGGPLAAESLANVLAVRLIRHLSAPRQLERSRDGVLPQGRLRRVVEYIEEHLESGLTLEQIALVARLSTYHFSRQFKAATGLPPHQYVIARRVERAKQLLQESKHNLSLALVAAEAGFSDQSQLSRHFKRLVGVTPAQFKTPARIA